MTSDKSMLLLWERMHDGPKLHELANVLRLSNPVREAAALVDEWLRNNRQETYHLLPMGYQAGLTRGDRRVRRWLRHYRAKTQMASGQGSRWLIGSPRSNITEAQVRFISHATSFKNRTSHRRATFKRATCLHSAT